METLAQAFCPCCKSLLEKWRLQRVMNEERGMLRAGGTFRRRKFRFGFSTGPEVVTAKLHADVDTVLQWRKDGEEGDWHEVDLCDVKQVEPSGTSTLTLASRTGDVLLELEAESIEARDAWVGGLRNLVEDLRANPQKSAAQKSVRDRLTEQANKQKHFAMRQLELRDKKREAEARKAKLIEETGGLKYTAIAMANRA